MPEENNQHAPQKKLRQNICADTCEQNGDSRFVTPDAIAERNNTLSDDRDE